MQVQNNHKTQTARAWSLPEAVSDMASVDCAAPAFHCALRRKGDPSWLCLAYVACTSPLAAVAVSRWAPPHPNTCTLPAGAMFSGGCFWEGAGGKSNIADSRKGSENLWEFRVRLPSSYQDAEGMQG